MKQSRIDQAWNGLRNRIELHEMEYQPRLYFGTSPLRLSVLTAAIVLVLVVLSTLFLWDFSNVDYKYIENNQNQTLVSVLEDGSVVYMLSNSKLTIMSMKENSRVVELKGDALFDVKRDGKSNFIVKTDKYKIEVLGTSFELQENSVKVLTGRVNVKASTIRKSLTLTTGDAIELFDGKYEFSNSSKSIERYLDSSYEKFLHNLHFKDVKLSQLIEIINKHTYRYDGVSIKTDVSEIDNRVITATFASVDPKEVSSILAELLNLKVVEEGKSIILRR